MFKNILVALDGSEHALKAARIAREMATCLQADLWVVVAYDPLPSYLGDPVLQEVITTRLSHSEEILIPACMEIGQIPGDVENGNPGRTCGRSDPVCRRGAGCGSDHYGHPRAGDVSRPAGGKPEPESGSSRPLPGAFSEVRQDQVVSGNVVRSSLECLVQA